MNNELTPTLWRTCRMLANNRRLALLKAMVDAPPQSVGQLAERCGMSEAAGSQYLRQINARGLCRAVRQGRWVLYELSADPKVRGSAALLGALRAELRSCKDDFHRPFHALTAYTHPRRIAIVRYLQAQGPCAVDSLRKGCALSAAALWRHLDKLSRRGVVEETKDSVALLPPASELARLLLGMALEG
jgi:DNA-binding transcriptional ArsR family regulator